MTHYCPSCGEFSWHGPGSAPWALECPTCGKVAKQHPHPPVAPKPARATRKKTTRKRTPKKKTPAPVVEDPAPDET